MLVQSRTTRKIVLAPTDEKRSEFDNPDVNDGCRSYMKWSKYIKLLKILQILLQPRTTRKIVLTPIDEEKIRI